MYTNKCPICFYLDGGYEDSEVQENGNGNDFFFGYFANTVMILFLGIKRLRRI